MAEIAKITVNTVGGSPVQEARFGTASPEWAAYCWDIGSHLRGNFGWARAGNFTMGSLAAGLREEETPALASGVDLGEVLGHMEDDLRRGRVVSLGIEAPCFLPGADSLRDLGRGRTGEGSRACFAPAGCSVSLFGLQQLAYGLSQLRRYFKRISVRWEERDALGPGDLQVWEAFVSGPAHSRGGNHATDALTGVVAFCHEFAGMPGAQLDVPVFRPGVDLSLIAVAAQWAGVEGNDDLWGAGPKVIRPAQPHHDFQNQLEPYIQKFGHTFSFVTLAQAGRRWLATQMALALSGGRGPISDDELYPDLPPGALL